MTHPLTYLLLFGTALLAGAINSVAGGGTLLTYPALFWAGVPAVDANATSTVALVPGSLSAVWGYRGEMAGSRRDLLWMVVPSLIGGFLGARYAEVVGDAVFARLVPWLILGATALFMAQEPVRRWQTRGEMQDGADKPTGRGGVLGAALFQFFVALYGGFFGAGIGILMLAALGFLGLTNIHRMNGMKNFAAVCINGVAALTFIFGGQVHWPLALLMMAGAILGGYGGAGVARRLGQKNVRRLVSGIGITIGAVLLARQLHLL